MLFRVRQTFFYIHGGTDILLNKHFLLEVVVARMMLMVRGGGGCKEANMLASKESMLSAGAKISRDLHGSNILFIHQAPII